MKKNISNKLILGSIIVLAGTLCLLLNIGVLSQAWKPIIFSWQTLLIFLGIINFTLRNYWSGTIFTEVGTYFILPMLLPVLGLLCPVALLHASLVPVAIISLGILMVANHLRYHYHHYTRSVHVHQRIDIRKNMK